MLSITRTAKDLKKKPPHGVDPDATEYKLRLREALAISDNAAAQKVLEEVGAPNVIDFAKALGIESQLLPTPSLALGAYEVTPIELTAAVATFGAAGEYRPPVLVKRITDSSGHELPLPPQPPARQVIPAEEAYLITSALTSVVKDGTAKAANSLQRPLAGKTGTTNLAKDAWFVGYSTDFVAGVWVGYDEAMPLGFGEAGAVTALPIWMAFMKTAEAGRPAVDFPRPPGIVTVRIDPITGLLAAPDVGEGIEEEYLDGTAPTEVSTPAAPPRRPVPPLTMKPLRLQPPRHRRRQRHPSTSRPAPCPKCRRPFDRVKRGQKRCRIRKRAHGHVPVPASMKATNVRFILLPSLSVTCTLQLAKPHWLGVKVAV